MKVSDFEVRMGILRRFRRHVLGVAIQSSLVMLIIGTIIKPAAGDDRPVADDARVVPRPKQAQDDPELAEFLRIYRLDEDEDIKHIPPPRPVGINNYWKRARPGVGNRPGEFGAMTFRWKEPDRLTNWSVTTAEAGFTLRDLPRYLEMDIYPAEIEGDPALLKTAVVGDWIYRAGIPDDRKARTLEIRLQRVLRRKLSVKRREVERDVVIVRGEYHSSPVKGRDKNQVEIYGKQIVPDGGGAGGGSGTYDEFLKWVGEWIERPVVSEVDPKPKGSFAWFYNARSPFTEQMRKEDHDEGLVLQHLQEQTGLIFTRGKRVIPILFIEEAK